MDEWVAGLRTALAGRYAVERELGSGGMAIVFLARDLRLERQVALKVLRPEIASSLGGERFLREIRVTAALQHPHILTLHDSDVAAGHPFYVMPYIEGESLAARLQREGALPVEEAVRFALEIAGALAYAHGRDVVHRDIKPGNILLSGGHALVADFGIARAIVASGLKLTETGMAVGTPAYMSPEQSLADAHVDGRADIYGLGCVLYEMLSGAPPFTGPTAQAVRARHAMEPVPPLRAVRPAVPEALEATIVKALAKTPADRFPTAEAFAATLEGFGSGAFRPAIRGSRRIRGAPAAIAAAVLLVGLLTWEVWRRADRAHSRMPALTSIAVLPLRNLGDSNDAYFADGLTQEMTNALTRVGGLGPRPFATVAAEAAKGGEPVTLGRRLGVDYVLDGSMRRSGEHFRVTVELVRVNDGVAAWSPRSYDGSGADVFAMQDSITRQLVGDLAGRLTTGTGRVALGRGQRDPGAYDLYLQGRHYLNMVTPDGDRKAIALFQSAIARDSTLGEAWTGLARSYETLIQLSGEAPVEIVGAWRRAVDRAVAIDSVNGEAYAARGALRTAIDWEYEGARSDFLKAIAVSPGSAEAQQLYAQFLNLVSQDDSSLAVMRRALALDPTNAWYVTNLATRFVWVGNLKEAAAEARRALMLDSLQWVAHLMLAEVDERAGNPAEAAEEAELAHRGLGDVPFVLGHLAYHYGRADRRRDAEATLATLTDIARREYVEGVWLALASLGVGDRQGALDALEASARARDNDLAWMLGLRTFEELRGDPRYEALLRRVGLAVFMRPRRGTAPS